MRLIHCADLHLDSEMTANLSKEKARERKKELLLTFQRMIDYAAENEVAAILIAGDLFDTRNISATARHAVWDAILGHSEIAFFYLRGNHDTEHFLAEREMLPENLKVFGPEWASYPLGERIVVSGLELSEENAGSAYHSLVLRPEKINIVMLHGQETKTGAKDRAQVIRLRDLKNKGIDYLALGHVHAAKEGQLDARGVWCYPGCLEGRGFDECGEHGFVLLDVDENTGTVKRQFVPFASRRLWEVPVDISGSETPSEMLGKIRAKIGNRASGEQEQVRTKLDEQMGSGQEQTRTMMSEQMGGEQERVPSEMNEQVNSNRMNDGQVSGEQILEDRNISDQLSERFLSTESESEEKESGILSVQSLISDKDMVKVVLTGETDVETRIDLEYLRKSLEPEYYFVKIYDETTLRVDTDQFLLDESLKGEFVRTVMAAEELSEEDRAAVIRCGLRAIAGEEVLGCD